ncbi:L,D-transpeptidase family protein [Polluticoccus soli]|uniref:L,D-transpeptidase family protein n=1 Tax=Polluticoccus soli TaxID=3034150 RepID=UPI0023E244C6|nr:L,D-transpeptidase family protein [Flavipsychrobacter sp. JY13-12]
MMKAGKLLRSLVLGTVAMFASAVSYGQDDVQTFRNFQFSFNRVSQAWTKTNDTLQKLFRQQGLSYPPSDIYIRTFKAQNEMELWARDNDTAEYKLVKNYRICALSGILGPKRVEGDRQVPEGLYFIEDFNPKSDFHLSMLLNYPNYSDMVLGDKAKPGGDIYIHGGCVTVGCMPMTDGVIQELYTLCLNAKLSGQTYIPVHIFPTRFTKTGLNFLGTAYAGDDAKQRFWVNLKSGYDYFERYHRIQPVMYTPDGKYVLQNN